MPAGRSFSVTRDKTRASSAQEEQQHRVLRGERGIKGGAIRAKRLSPGCQNRAYSLFRVILPARRATSADANSTPTIRSKISGNTKKYRAMMIA